ncbi:cardiolipin synthase [Weissella soli]|uniref:cardiolipin synthase n=1 Tax=Weissella soli TaxID=155866 RepID=UPI0021BEC7F8|nr:cardiolipin synthase [Weissella soli]MCT8395390.1 cardiolipin synthase [Weissella soli]
MGNFITYHLAGTLLWTTYILNMLAAIITIFRERRDVTSIWAWLVVLLGLPIIGFVIYFFLGRKLSSKKIFSLQTQERMGLNEIARNQKLLLDEVDDQFKEKYEEQSFVRLFLQNEEAILTQKNAVRIFTDGHKKFAQLFDDIERAKHHVNLEYFTIYDDQIGNELVDLLTRKAKQGVRIRVIYDQMGSKGRHDRMYKRLRAAGGQVEPFMAPHFLPVTFRANFRDHRKLVIVDGTIGYIGGFNVGDQYLGRFPKFGYWRDTHLRIEGDAVLALQSRFFTDWNATVRKQKLDFAPEYFPTTTVRGNTAMQIVTSGPDTDEGQIEQGYLKLFATAKQTITIQSPYFIPDASILKVLRMQALSGVRVRLMIPHMPDHPFVYRATEYYAQEILDAGAEVYRYDAGFLHAKVVTVDGRIASVGSANMDIRSFGLNFESNAFMYDQEITEALEQIFELDVLQSTQLTTAYFKNQSYWKRFKQRFSRLLSPIL